MLAEKTEPRARTALERHARFFDPDHDEAVTPSQSLRGMTSLGMSSVMAIPLSLLINFFLGRLTRQKSSLSISVPNIKRGKHPFSTGVFDADGNLDEAAFAELFEPPHARAPRDCLTYGELRRLVLRKGDPEKPFGPLGSLLTRAFSAAEVSALSVSYTHLTLPTNREV